MGLSKFLTSVLTLKAANVQLQDICGQHKPASVEVLQNYFCLLEVYGNLMPINYFDPSIFSLKQYRMKTLVDLKQIDMKYRDLQHKIPEEMKQLKTDLVQFYHIISKVIEYYASKT